MKVLEVMQGLAFGTGTASFFTETVRYMVRAGVEVTVLCIRPRGHDVANAPIYASVKDLPVDYRPDVVHVHGLWNPLLALAHHWAHKRHIPVLESPHGALSPWARKSKWLKKLPYWLLVEKPELKQAAAFHVTAEEEGRWVRDCGFLQPQIIAPLGVALPVLTPENEVKGKRTIISVGRLYRVKGLDRLVKAVRLLKTRGQWAGWKMVLAGQNWMGYRPELENLIASLGLLGDIELPGPVYGEDKDRLFRSASIYAVASHTENFCQPVAEALSYGVPVVASTGTPWSGLETHGCGIWTENDPESLAQALKCLMLKTDDERSAMGLRGRAWMTESFSWSAVGQKMVDGLSLLVDRRYC